MHCLKPWLTCASLCVGPLLTIDHHEHGEENAIGREDLGKDGEGRATAAAACPYALLHHVWSGGHPAVGCPLQVWRIAWSMGSMFCYALEGTILFTVA